jgi:lipoprotein-releasing system permease protein
VILSRYERVIAKRYLLPGKGEGFIFLVASISLVAVMLGVAALIIVMSVMNGFRAELFDKIVGLNGHAVVQGYGGRLPNWQEVARQVQATPGVTEAVPLIEQPLMSSHDGRVGRRAPARHAAAGHPQQPHLAGEGDRRFARQPAARLGQGRDRRPPRGSARCERRRLDHDHQPAGQHHPFGTVPDRPTTSGDFEVGVYDYDKAFVVMPIEDAQTC